jgi:NAD(P)-dependent dehydrogenase (short-subunit alcohol dehydrogenase family)
MDLSGRVVLITGGKRMGLAVASAFAVGGADVALAYNRSRADAEQAAVAVEAVGRRAILSSGRSVALG